VSPLPVLLVKLERRGEWRCWGEKWLATLIPQKRD
jgi:hypothetical protein